MYGILAELFLDFEIFELYHVLHTPSCITPDWTSASISKNVITRWNKLSMCALCASLLSVHSKERVSYSFDRFI